MAEEETVVVDRTAITDKVSHHVMGTPPPVAETETVELLPGRTQIRVGDFEFVAPDGTGWGATIKIDGREVTNIRDVSITADLDEAIIVTIRRFCIPARVT